ncbi:efflux RND transporter periplasmic adaptor subunit [bacterium]|nr:efflux RND transporter periplasmic adaptor subunit [bacterium]
MKKVIALVVVLVVVVAAIWYTNSAEAEARLEYRFVTLESGNLESVVASTGKLNAVTTVQVGTQVSGIVNKIYVDFNNKVRKGQVIARIDTTLLVSSVEEARATLNRNQAQLDFSQTEYDRIRGLYEKQFSTEVEMNSAKYNLDLAKATIVSSRISLERAQRNLSYATIVSPIDGVVVERNVDEGQTVAASLNTPQLFLIANDLARMEILASVDESDIGLIKQGQQVRFTVQAYDNSTFLGRVRQVRLQSAVQENVVTYTAVVDVDNSDGRLLPGMTATVEFLIEQVSDVIKVPNAALRFRPNEEMMAQIRAKMEASGAGQGAAGGPAAAGGTGAAAGQGAAAGRAGGQTGGAPGGGQGRPAGFGGQGSNSGTLWYLDSAGDIQMARVKTGITDGSQTEVTGETLEAGMQIISGVTLLEEGSGMKNPFQSESAGGGRGGFSRGGGF